MTDDDASQVAEIPAPTGAGLLELGRRWIERIEASKKREKSWRSEADKAFLAYTGEEAGQQSNRKTFNILHSNVETIVPAIYNSTPAPDIRRRFLDPDETSRVTAQVIERCISVQLDDGALDQEIEAMAQDAYIAGRGVIRVRLNAEDGREWVSFENVPWRDYAEGPATRWALLPWAAFRLTLTKDDSDEIADHKTLSSQTSEGDYRYEGEPSDDVTVWEVWCAKKKEVLFIRENDAAILKIVDDPLGLSGFFPVPKPMQPITISGVRTPVTPYSIYRELAEELDIITKRIRGLVSGMKLRGATLSGSISSDIADWAKAGDNEIVGVRDVEAFAQAGGMDKLIAWWPIERAVATLRELVVQREQTKQAIYEITGISDIVRGASEASETATAQQIKTQWGSLRIKKMQREVERIVRDAFKITAELIATKFTPQTMQEASGIQVTPEMLELLANPVLRTYRIDVESESTIRGDVSRSQQEMNAFLAGTGSFLGAVGPAVQSGQMPADVAIEIYSAFARTFKLGRQAEDALERMSEQAKEDAKQPQQQKPDPAAMEAERRVQESQAQMQLRQAEAQQSGQIRMQEIEANIAMQREKMAGDLEIAREKLLQDFQIAIARLEMDAKTKAMAV